MTLDAVARDPEVKAVTPDRDTITPQSKKRAKRPSLALQGIIVALLILVVANVGIELNRRYFDLLSSGGAEVEPDLGKAQRCESLGRRPDVVFLGSSRAEDGTDAPLVDTLAAREGKPILSCNLAMSGATFASDYFMLKRVIEDGYTPKLVVENLFEFNINANGDVDHYAPGYNHARWLADAEDVSALQPTFGAGSAEIMQSADFLAQKLIPLYGDRIGVLKTICQGSTFGPCGDPQTGVSWAHRDWYKADQLHGWRPAEGPSLANLPPDRQQDLQDAIAYFRNVYLRNFKLIDHEPTYLAKLVALAQAHHIPLAFVVSPLNQRYLDLLPAAEWTQIHAYWQAFSDAHHVPFYDESQDHDYTDADFHDPHHLSVEGAQKYSAWLEHTIVQPML